MSTLSLNGLKNLSRGPELDLDLTCGQTDVLHTPGPGRIKRVGNKLN